MYKYRENSIFNQIIQVFRRKTLATLNWTSVDSDGSLFSRGKNDYYAMLVRGIPEERPKDCIIELYVTDKEMTLPDIKYNPDNERIKLLSRIIVSGNLYPVESIQKAIEEMKEYAQRRESENPYSSVTSAYTSK
jgi:hypothetical protein